MSSATIEHEVAVDPPSPPLDERKIYYADYEDTAIHSLYAHQVESRLQVSFAKASGMMTEILIKSDFIITGRDALYCRDRQLLLEAAYRLDEMKYDSPEAVLQQFQEQLAQNLVDRGRLTGVSMWTDAPIAYDGFGTVTAHTAEINGKTYRHVYAYPEHAAWQSQRYGSGMYISMGDEMFYDTIGSSLRPKDLNSDGRELV